MSRTIFLLICSNASQPAHWAIWIPTTGQQKIGKLLHVNGNPAIGFFLEFRRNYDMDETPCPYQILPLGQAHDQYVADTPVAQGVDTIARDRLETVALGVLPPARSANPFDPAAPNSQNWIVDFVEQLIAQGYLAAAARAVVQGAPTKI